MNKEMIHVCQLYVIHNQWLSRCNIGDGITVVANAIILGNEALFTDVWLDWIIDYPCFEPMISYLMDWISRISITVNTNLFWISWCAQNEKFDFLDNWQLTSIL